MKITFEQSELLNALNLINGACGALNTLPILSCAMIQSEAGEVTIIGNDLEIAIEVKTPAVISEDGAIAVPVKRLLSLVKVLPSDVLIEMEADRENLKVTCNGDTYKLIGMETDEYPMRAEVEGETFTITCNELQRILRRTEFAACKDEVRYTLHSVFFNEREIVATDGTMFLARLASPIKTPKFLIPLQTVKELRKTFKDVQSDITVKVGTNTISFTNDYVRLTSRLIEGEFPPYFKIIPEKYWLIPQNNKNAKPKEDVNTIIVSKLDIETAVRRVSVFACDRTSLVILEIGEGQIQLSCHNEEAGNSKAFVKCTGPGSVRMGLNVLALLEVLSQIEGDSVAIEFFDDMLPMLIKPADTDDFITVIMPMRIDKPL